MQTYPIKAGSEIVGEATVQKEGLYYHIFCRCQRKQRGICRILLRCKEKSADLGICVPDGGFYCTKRSVPIKKIGADKLEFYVISNVERQDKLIEICAEKPFASIDKLETAQLVQTDGKYYIKF